MLIGSAHNDKKFENLLAVNNERIRRNHVTKYLGLIVDDTLKWDLHIDYIVKNLKRILVSMKHVKSCVPNGSLTMLCKKLLNLNFRFSTLLGENVDNN